MRYDRSPSIRLVAEEATPSQSIQTASLKSGRWGGALVEPDELIDIILSRDEDELNHEHRVLIMKCVDARLRAGDFAWCDRLCAEVRSRGKVSRVLELGLTVLTATGSAREDMAHREHLLRHVRDAYAEVWPSAEVDASLRGL